VLVVPYVIERSAGTHHRRSQGIVPRSIDEQTQARWGRAVTDTEPCEDGAVGSDGDGEPVEDGAPADSESDDGEANGGFDRWRKESALGGVGTGIARGLQAVFAPRPDEVVIVAAVPGEPPDADQRLRVILDPDDPTKSVAIVPDPAADPPAS
jgi:hypothetical protein